MNIQIGTYNLNNLFERPKIMELKGFSKEASIVLNDVSALNALLEKNIYDTDTKQAIEKILNKYFHDESTSNPWFEVIEIREKLFSRKRDGSGIEVKAKGREDWLGWVELNKQVTNEISLENTARVISSIGVDILCTVEVDNRVALNRFNNWLLKDKNSQFSHCMLIDGNDERGIDVGLLSNFDITQIVSHIDDYYTGKNKVKNKIFSRDCPEYKIQIDNTHSIYFLCNHLKSKGYGSQSSSDAKRRKQADRITEILQKFDLQNDMVVVAGDFNDTPGGKPLSNLMKLPGLYNVLNWPNYIGEKWTYHDGKSQFDYLLVSKPIFDNLLHVGIERRGIFKKNNPTFPEVTNKVTQASDHGAVWAEFKIP
jgi:endonuclease/exonuclease/phosphatase family metal-dependent hydrolase